MDCSVLPPAANDATETVQFQSGHCCAEGAASCPSVRHASKKAGGSTKNSKGSNAQRLGVKLFHGQACKPGSIIIRQRGTKWRPSENVGMGKDHTLYSLMFGRVAFFKHPETKRTHVRVVSDVELIQEKLLAQQQAEEMIPFLASDPLNVQRSSSL
jgi:large subunit ribosomal protein L27